MELLVCIINQEEKLEAILNGFWRLGVSGATVINSEGMGRLLGDEIPVFSGLQELMSQSRPTSRTILSVIQDPDLLDAAVNLVQELCGDMNAPSTGIVFTVPVSRVAGLRPRRTPEAE